jgi:solute carrier family 24 (sodium/potassium/calcium exchanger), member 6
LLSDLYNMGDEATCTYKYLSSLNGTSAQCIAVQTYCSPKLQFYIDFYKMHYCTFNGNFLPTLFLGTIVIFIIFNVLSNTCEEYMAPSLLKISKKLKMSEVLAGVTLIALANGAPDVISSFAAGGDSDNGLQLSIGALFGANLFTTTLIMARCIYLTPKTQEIKLKFTQYRDLAFFVITSCVVLLLGYIKTITPLIVALYFVLYVVYMVVVLSQEKRLREEAAQETQQ